MPELERRGRPWRQILEKRIEDGEILFQIGRELKQKGTELVAEGAGDAAEGLDELAAVLQTTVVRDAARSLQRELERRRRLRGPAAHELFARHPVERVVDFDRRKPRRVIRKHLRRRKIRGIEAALPLRVVVAGRSDPDHRDIKL